MEEKQEAIFPEGFIVKRPGENVPDFVKGKISVKVDEFIKFLNEHQQNGWVNLDLKVSQKGVLYTQLNTWKPKTEQPVNDHQAQAEYNEQPIEAEEIGF